ncbi:MAG: DUF4390 domain-containing protein [Candidatus Rokubacteria bacterium]|nr:DUF4390 domain-containing protein [Candidatus Rokubacteria bacterium]
MRVGIVLAVLLVAVLAAPPPGHAELRISDLDVFLNDQDVTVHVVALGAVPAGFLEHVQSGVQTHLRFTVELWRYNRMWRDTRLITRRVERQLEYNVVTKEYKIVSVHGEARSAYTTRDLRDAQRVLSELRGLKLTPASALDPADIFYVRVLAETALRGEHTWVSRVAGTAEQATRQSDHRTIMRVQ